MNKPIEREEKKWQRKIEKKIDKEKELIFEEEGEEWQKKRRRDWLNFWIIHVLTKISK